MAKDLKEEKLKVLEAYAEKIAPKDDKETEFYKEVAKILLNPMLPKEAPAPEGSLCPNCQKKSLVTIRATAWGDYGDGTVKIQVE